MADSLRQNYKRERMESRNAANGERPPVQRSVRNSTCAADVLCAIGEFCTVSCTICFEIPHPVV